MTAVVISLPEGGNIDPQEYLKELKNVAETVYYNGMGFQPFETGGELWFVLASIADDQEIGGVKIVSGANRIKTYDFIGRNFLLVHWTEYAKRYKILDALVELKIPSSLWLNQVRECPTTIERPISQLTVEQQIYSAATAGLAPGAKLNWYGLRGELVHHLTHSYPYNQWNNFTVAKTEPMGTYEKKYDYRLFSGYAKFKDFLEGYE